MPLLLSIWMQRVLSTRLFSQSSAGTNDQRLSFIIHRLENRVTFCEWDKEIIGPITDALGIEQGGLNSSEFYKIYNNEQLTVPQESDLGVHVASIGQADDIIEQLGASHLVSSSFTLLSSTVRRTMSSCPHPKQSSSSSVLRGALVMSYTV